MDFNTSPAPYSTPGTLHFIPKNLCAFEPAKPLVRSLNINTLVWVGGMFDTLGCTAYPFSLAQALGPTWSLVTCSLSSAGLGWGVRSVASDAEDLGRIIAYLKERRPGGKVVVMGHSTGCQDCMEYVVGAGSDGRVKVDGVVLQAPCSDREILEKQLPEAVKHEADQLALKWVRERRGKDALPNRLTGPVFGRLAVSASRWVDVSSPGPDHSGGDDYFSSDFGAERLRGTFGRLPASVPLLVLFSGSDEFCPEKIDKEGLVRGWVDVVKESGGCVDEENGGVVPGASHSYSGNSDEIVQDMVKRVVGFIGKIDNGSFAKGNDPKI